MWPSTRWVTGWRCDILKFRAKMTLCMLGLLAILFGIGGSLLITISMRDAMVKERAALYDSYLMAIGTIKIVGITGGGLSDESAADTLRQLYELNGGRWVNSRFYMDGRTVYQKADVAVDYGEGHPEPGACEISYRNAGGRHLLILKGTLAGEEEMYLDMASEIPSIFKTEERQRMIYRYVFVLLIILCAILSYGISHLLTLPLVRLSNASRAIAEGRLSYRSRIKSGDEIGALSQDFDAMADKLEGNINELEEAIKRQDRFVGSFAHEMKTPMTSIIGYADLIRSGILSKGEERQAAEYIFSEGKRLENLSRKLLELIVLKEGASLRPASPSAMIEELAETLRPVYRAKGIEIVVDCQRGEAMLEPDLFKSLVTNLMDNARKAMDGKAGRITVKSVMTDEGCRLVVTDEGRGMPQEALTHVTEAFYRVDKSRARRQGGVGLGLALCNEIVQLHNGNIAFDSAEGSGTTVTVELKGGRA